MGGVDGVEGEAEQERCWEEGGQVRGTRQRLSPSGHPSGGGRKEDPCVGL